MKHNHYGKTGKEGFPHPTAEMKNSGLSYLIFSARLPQIELITYSSSPYAYTRNNYDCLLVTDQFLLLSMSFGIV